MAWINKIWMECNSGTFKHQFRMCAIVANGVTDVVKGLFSSMSAKRKVSDVQRDKVVDVKLCAIDCFCA
ncbi:hypothetical protein Ancab_038296 [Ancistrocladus abbreviatus]